MLCLIAAVAVLDQAAKWWAWRQVPWTKINSGGDILVGTTVGGWYASPVTGALLDLLDFGLLSIAVSALARWRALAAVRVPGALMIGGWGSNLLDRLGIHYWTAPGSVRGVVDFIHLGSHYYNVADFFIIGCTPLFLLAAACHAVLAARRPAAARSAPAPARSWVRLRARMRDSALAKRRPDSGRHARRGELRRRERGLKQAAGKRPCLSDRGRGDPPAHRHPGLRVARGPRGTMERAGPGDRRGRQDEPRGGHRGDRAHRHLPRAAAG